MIPYNPADRANLPKKKKFVGKAYSIDKALEMLDVFVNEPIEPVVILGLFYGLRRSEALGLRWQDIDFDQGKIFIRNTVVRYRTVVEEEQTKSEASCRTLFIIPETQEYLIGLHKKQMEQQLLLGSQYHNSDHVCKWNDGRPFKVNYVSKRFSDILKRNHLPHIRFHDLRHTAGSLLLESGLSIKQIQEYLGHEQASTTLDIYGHLSIEGKKESANAMGRILKSKVG